MKTFTPFLETLPEAQQNIWPSLAPVSSLEFVLYGGTAIALQLGHRISGDFIFFNNNQLDKDKLYEQLPFCQKGRILQDQPNVLTLTHAGVEFSFSGGVNFGDVGTPLATEDRVLTVASLDDLMAMEIRDILQRSSVKDYQDIAAMVEAGVSLEKGLTAARQMCGGSYPLIESLCAMDYFESGDLVKSKKAGK